MRKTLLTGWIAAIGMLAVAGVCHARVQGPALGSLYPSPNSTNGCVATTNGTVDNTCADGSGNTFTWLIPLPMDNTGAKTPVVRASGLFAPTDTSYCKGHRVSDNGAIVASTAQQNFVFGTANLTMPSLTLAAGETYILACQLGGNTEISKVTYTP
jgi:hypothetical protein